MARRLLTGAMIWSGADRAPRPGWLLVQDELIAQVGDGPSPDADEVADLAGHHILPGFVDTHTHLTLAARQPRGCDGSGWRSLDEALREVRRAAGVASDAPWLLCWNVSVSGWPEARLPTAAELDAAAPGRRVLVCGVDLHRGAVSSAALDELDLRGAQPGDVGRGRAAGELWEAAFGSALRAALSEPGDVDELLRAEAVRHLAFGITHAHDPFVPPALHERLRKLAAATPLRLSWATGSAAGLLHRPDDPADAPPGPYGDGPREVKIFLDGADRCGLSLPARALPGLVGGTVAEAWRLRALGPVRAGLRRKVVVRRGRVQLPYCRMADDELAALLAGYAEQGFRLRLHALGNLAAAQAARALTAVRIPAGTATIDHLTALDQETADLVAASGAYAGYQPGFLPRFGPQFVSAGIDRHLAILGGRTITAAGAPLVLSSDHPCGPLDPLRNLRTAVRRTLAGGRVLQAGEALTREEAVRAATVNAAASLDAAGSAGLAPGEAADLVVCTGDPFDEATRVAATWVAGARVWADGTESPRSPSNLPRNGS